MIGPLLRLLSGDQHFLLLALSQRKIRVMEGSRNTVEEVRLGEVPTSLRDVVRPPEPRSDTMARPAATATRGGRPSSTARRGDEHFKKDRAAAVLARGLDRLAGGAGRPRRRRWSWRVSTISWRSYRAVNSYGYLMEDAVIPDPDQLSAEELHRLAWPVVRREAAP